MCLCGHVHLSAAVCRDQSDVTFHLSYSDSYYGSPKMAAGSSAEPFSPNPQPLFENSSLKPIQAGLGGLALYPSS